MFSSTDNASEPASADRPEVLAAGFMGVVGQPTVAANGWAVESNKAKSAKKIIIPA